MADLGPTHYIENVPPEDWPQQTVACRTDGCPGYGEALTVPDIGQNVVCGLCGQPVQRVRG